MRKMVNGLFHTILKITHIFSHKLMVFFSFNTNDLTDCVWTRNENNIHEHELLHNGKKIRKDQNDFFSSNLFGS
jgi:hypothetical protein